MARDIGQIDIGQIFGFFLEDVSEGAGQSPRSAFSPPCGAGNGETLPRRADGASNLRGPDSTRSPLPWLEVPPSGIGYLLTVPGESPEILDEPPVSTSLTSVLEAIRYQGQTYLAMLPGEAIRSGGWPLPPVAILRVGDEVRVGDRWLLHVSRFTRPYVGPPEELVGKPCSYCRIAFVPETVVYICPYCATPVHCEHAESASNPEVGPLECARLMSECHHCHQPVVLEASYEYVPNR